MISGALGPWDAYPLCTALCICLGARWSHLTVTTLEEGADEALLDFLNVGSRQVLLLVLVSSRCVNACVGWDC